MKEQLTKRLTRTNKLLLDFLAELPEELLSSKLANLPSNEIGQQYWCVIGARQSYLKAAIAGSWQGFECPLPWGETSSQNSIKQALDSTSENLLNYIKEQETLPENTQNYLLDLLEHEIQHHGQLIRYMYGLKVGAPGSWKERYNLD